jgi:hypothetical protein
MLLHPSRTQHRPGNSIPGPLSPFPPARLPHDNITLPPAPPPPPPAPPCTLQWHPRLCALSPPPIAPHISVLPRTWTMRKRRALGGPSCTATPTSPARAVITSLVSSCASCRCSRCDRRTASSRRLGWADEIRGTARARRDNGPVRCQQEQRRQQPARAQKGRRSKPKDVASDFARPPTQYSPRLAVYGRRRTAERAGGPAGRRYGGGGSSSSMPASRMSRSRMHIACLHRGGGAR